VLSETRFPNFLKQFVVLIQWANWVTPGGVYSGRGYLHIRPVPELFLKEKGYHQKTYVVLKVLGFKLSVAMRSLVFPSGLFKRTESMGSAAARWRSCPYLFVVCSSLRNRSKLLDRI